MKKEQPKTKETKDFRNVMLPLSGYVAGDRKDYQDLKNLVKTYRLVTMKAVSTLFAADMVSVDYAIKKKSAIVSKKGVNKGKTLDDKTKEYENLVSNPNNPAAKELLRIFGGADSLTKNETLAHDAYEIRPMIVRETEKLLATFGISETVDSSFFDCVKDEAATAYKKKDPKMKAPASLLAMSGIRGLPTFTRTPLRVMRAPSSGREYAELIWNEQEDSYVLRLYVLKDRHLDILLQGWMTLPDGERKWKTCNSARLLHSMVNGSIEYCSPTINFNDEGQCTVCIPYRDKERKENPKAIKGKTLEVAIFPRSKRPFKKARWMPDVEYKYMIHCFASTSGKNAVNKTDKYQRWAIPVDEVARQLDILKHQSERLMKASASCRQGGAKLHSHLVTKFRDKQGALAKKRFDYSNSMNHTWAKRITDQAFRWNCEKIQVFIPESCNINGRFFQHQWAWTDLAKKIEQQASIRDIKYEEVSASNVEDTFKLLDQQVAEKSAEETQQTNKDEITK